MNFSKRRRDRNLARRTSARRLRVEHLEHRVVLTSLVHIRLAVTDLAGNAVSDVEVGESFHLTASVEDLRDSPAGVFGAYMDVIYSPLLAIADPLLINHGDFRDGATADFSSPGLVDEVGAFRAIVAPPGGGVFPLFSIPFTAVTTGTLTFAADPADLHGNDVLLYGIDTAIPADQVNYGSVSIAVHEAGPNLPPTASTDAYTTGEDEMLVRNAAEGVLANDTDADEDALTAIIRTQPSHGTVTLQRDGSFSYTPRRNFNGTDTFTYRAFDGRDFSKASVEITITAVDDPPLAVNDHYLFDGQGQLNGKSVLDNDVEYDGQSLTASLATGPGFGTVTLNEDGTFVYVPDETFAGTDTFTYEASDGLLSSSATVRLGPDSPHDLIVGIQAVTTSTTGQPISAINVGDPFLLTVLVEDLRSDPQGVFAAYMDVTYDAALARVAGPIRYTADFANGTKGDTSEAGLLDEAGGFSNARLLGEGVFQVFEVPFIATAAGDFHIDLNPADEYVNEVLVYGKDERVEATETHFQGTLLNIAGSAGNSQPLALDDSFEMSPASDHLVVPAATGLLTNDVDTDGDPLTAVLDVAPTHGSVTLHADGSFEYRASDDFLGFDSFSYHASDGQLDSNVATVRIRQEQQSSSEVRISTMLFNVAGDEISSVRAGQEFYLFVMTEDLGNDDPIGVFATYVDVRYDSDIVTVTGPLAYNGYYTNGQEGDASTPGLIDDAGAFGATTPPGAGKYQVFSVPLVATAAGSVAFELDPADGHLLDVLVYGKDHAVPWDNVALEGSLLTVTGGSTNAPPTAQGDSFTLNEDTVLIVNASAGVLSNDTDPESDALVATLTTSPQSGSILFRQDGSFEYRPHANFSGQEILNYRISDGHGHSTLATLTIDIAPVNDPPVAVDDRYKIVFDRGFTPMLETASGIEDAALHILLNDSVGPDAGESLTIVQISTPTQGGEATWHDDLVTYTPPEDFIGEESFTYVVSDGSGTTDSATVTIEIASRHQNPRNRLDTDDNGDVVPADALYPINFLNTFGTRVLQPSDIAEDVVRFLDTSGDGQITPFDPLLVINYLNAAVGSVAGGEAVDLVLFDEYPPPPVETLQRDSSAATRPADPAPVPDFILRAPTPLTAQRRGGATDEAPPLAAALEIAIESIAADIARDDFAPSASPSR